MFVLFLFVSFLFHSIETADEIATVIADAQQQIFETENDLIKEQMLFKEAVKAAKNITKDARNCVKNNVRLLKLMKLLNDQLGTLRTFLKLPNFEVKKFVENTLTSCKKLHGIIDYLEERVFYHLQSKRDAEETTTQFTQKTRDLKLEYFASYIFFNKTQSVTILAVIATSEKLFERDKSYISVMYSTSRQIASVLYDIKVVYYKFCKVEEKKKTSKQTKSSKSSAASTNLSRKASSHKITKKRSNFEQFSP